MIETGQFRTSNSTPIGSAKLPISPPHTPPNNAEAIGPAGYQLVQVWFGTHVVRTYRGPAAEAQRYAEAIGRRFAGLRVTVDPPSAAVSTAPPLPSERMWELVP